jgi:hypothetical protein
MYFARAASYVSPVDLQLLEYMIELRHLTLMPRQPPDERKRGRAKVNKAGRNLKITIERLRTRLDIISPMLGSETFLRMRLTVLDSCPPSLLSLPLEGL